MTSRRRRRRRPPLASTAVLLAAGAAVALLARSARLRARVAGAAPEGLRSAPGRVRGTVAGSAPDALRAAPSRVRQTVAAARTGSASLPGPLRRFGSQPGSEDYTCEGCGEKYRVTGLGRHRVYWPAGASESEPVLGTDCPSCGRALPA